MYLIFDKYPNLKIARQELKKLFELATSRTHFLFVGSYYDQIDGVAIGSPLGSVLANLFMGFHEKRFFYIMVYKYTFNTRNSWLIIKKVQS